MLLSLAVIDPVLGKSGLHSMGFAEMLAVERPENLETTVYCHHDIAQQAQHRLSCARIAVAPAFGDAFYRLFGKDGLPADHWPLILALAKEYQGVFEQVMARYPGQPMCLLHHTLWWGHAMALALAIQAGADRELRLRHLALLMFSPGMDAAGNVLNAQQSLGFRLGFSALSRCASVRLHASCSEYAVAYQRLLGCDDVIPLHPFLMGGGQRPSQRGIRPARNHLLYVGDMKPDKGFMRLPDQLRTMLAQARADDRFVVQFAGGGGETPDLLAAVANALNLIAGQDDRLQVHQGFWSETQLNEAFSAADVFYLNYQASEYQHKTSGLLWLAAWHRVHVVVPAHSWLEREAARLGMDYSLSHMGRVKVAGRESVEGEYAENILQPFLPWLSAQCQMP